MSRAYDPMFDQSFHGRTAEELLNAPIDALKGVSSSDAKKLAEAFRIGSVRDLAEFRFAERARAILAATGVPGFDPGPPPEWEAFFRQAPLGHYQSHPSRFRLAFGPVYYRGRLDGTARVVIVGQDPAADEILAHRTFVGFSGQRVQGLLRKLGLTRSYVMMNTFLFSVLGQFDSDLRAISLEPPILDYRNLFLTKLADRNPVEAVIAVGKGAQHAVDLWPGRNDVQVFEIQHPAALDEAALLATWNEALSGLAELVEPDDDGTPDLTPYGATFAPEDNQDIPRGDLPFGVPDWQGRGPHGSRDGDLKIIWTAP